jgi:type I restriction enzyme M protein
MKNESQEVVRLLWRYCDILRDDGMSYGDYVEQLTYLLFLKMAHERTQEPYYEESRLPKDCDWPSLHGKNGTALLEHYTKILKELGKEKGMLGVIFRNAENKIKDPAKLHRLIVNLIDNVKWTNMDTDVKGDAYEGLLQKNAEDRKSGAGQYFTPRPLIRAIVDVMRPQPGERIYDPACGTGGFLLAAYEYLDKHYSARLDPDKKFTLKNDTCYGCEIVEDTARLCVMNLFLHGIGDEESEQCPIEVSDSLPYPPKEHYDIVLSNPPFGRKSEGGPLIRSDFWSETSNKQLNFVQHIYTLLKPYGRAAVVVPDNVLFEGGAGQRIREKLLKSCDVHTLLRLPTGIFYAQGVKANVLFFDKRPGRSEPWTKKLWVYDLRTNQNFTMRNKALRREDLDDFVKAYHAENRDERQPTDNNRFCAFSYQELIKRDKLNLDIIWLHDDSIERADSIPPLEEITIKIVEDLRDVLEQSEAIAQDLGISTNESE